MRFPRGGMQTENQPMTTLPFFPTPKSALTAVGETILRPFAMSFSPQSQDSGRFGEQFLALETGRQDASRVRATTCDFQCLKRPPHFSPRVL
jgi:hypothetical protein